MIVITSRDQFTELFENNIGVGTTNTSSTIPFPFYADLSTTNEVQFNFGYGYDITANTVDPEDATPGHPATLGTNLILAAAQTLYAATDPVYISLQNAINAINDLDEADYTNASDANAAIALQVNSQLNASQQWQSLSQAVMDQFYTTQIIPYIERGITTSKLMSLPVPEQDGIEDMAYNAFGLIGKRCFADIIANNTDALAEEMAFDATPPNPSSNGVQENRYLIDATLALAGC